MGKAHKRSYRDTATAMFDDPDLAGEVLLVGLGILELNTRPPDERRLSLLAEMLGWDLTRLRVVVGRDVPRYQPTYPAQRTCAEMLIRYPRACGQRGSMTASIWDPATGERTLVDACSRHKQALWERSRASRDAWLENGAPEPAPNAGGVLARYFRGDWVRLYTWAGHKEITELDLVERQAPPRLRLLQGGLA